MSPLRPAPMQEAETGPGGAQNCDDLVSMAVVHPLSLRLLCAEKSCW